MRLKKPAIPIVVLLLTLPAMAREIKFVHTSTFASGVSSPTRLWVADLNGDRIPDLVICNSLNSIAVLIGNGDGTFKPPVVYTEDFYVTGGVAIADFNGDHKLDLAVVGGDDSGNGLALFTGNGDGTFNPPVYSVTSLAGASIVPVVGDFNHDGKPDIFVGGNGSSEVLLGSGNGTFTSSQVISASGEDVAICDLNHDGILDAATTDFIHNEVAILIGNGNGTFQSPSIINNISGAVGITCADLNNDGNPDLAVTLDNGVGSVAILLGDGTGGFTSSVSYFAGPEPGGIVAADFNLDKKIDLVASDYDGNGVTLLPGNGTGSFLHNFDFATGNQPADVVAGDFNRDGSLDLAVTNHGGNSVAILLNEAGTVVQLSSSPNPSRAGQPVTFTVAVTGSVVNSITPTGMVSLSADSKIIGKAALTNGTASFTAAPPAKGAYNITASYSGDSKFNPNESKVLIQNVQ